MGEEKTMTFEFPAEEEHTTPDTLRATLDRLSGEENYVIRIAFAADDERKEAGHE